MHKSTVLVYKLTVSVLADLLGLLKWRMQPDKIYVNLEKLMKLDGEEIVKVSLLTLCCAAVF